MNLDHVHMFSLFLPIYILACFIWSWDFFEHVASLLSARKISIRLLSWLCCSSGYLISLHCS